MGRPSLLKRLTTPSKSLSLTLSPDVVIRMESLIERCGCKDILGLIRMALSTLDLLVEAVEAKKTIILRAEEGKEQKVELLAE